MKSCTGCLYQKIVFMVSWNEHRDRCYRPHTMIDGRVVDTGRDGTDCSFERDGVPVSQRMAGDKCGYSRIHFTAREGVL